MSKVSVKFGAEDTNLSSTLNKVQKDLKQVETQSKETSQRFNISFKSMAAAGAGLAVGIGAIKLAFNAAKGTIDSFGEALDMGGRLNDLAGRTGESAGNMLLLERAFTNAGSSAENVGPTINKLQKFLVDAGNGADKNTDALKSLGLSFDVIKNKSPIDQLQIIASSLSGVTDPAKRSALAMTIFGKSGGELLPLLRGFSGSVGEAKLELGSMVSIMDKNNGAFDTASDKIAVIKGKFTEFAAGVLDKTIPAIELFTTALAQVDAAGIGQRLAAAFVGGQEAMGGFSSSLQALKGGEFALSFEMAFASIRLQAKQTINEIAANFSAGFQSIAQFITQTLGPGSATFNTIDLAFRALSKSMSSGFLETLANAVSAIPMIGESASRQMIEASKGAAAEALVYQTAMKGIALGIGDSFASAGKSFPDSFKKAYDSAEPLMDLKSDFAAVAKLQDEINKKAPELTHNMMDDVKQLPLATFDMREHLKDGAKAISKAAKDVAQSLSLSQSIIAKFKEFKAKDAIDPEGKLEKKANEALDRGDTKVAGRVIDKIKQREEEQSIKKAFGGDGKFGKSLKDIAKEQEIDTFRKTDRQIRKELLEKQGKGKGNEVNPNGKGAQEEKDKAQENVMSTIQKAVQAIQKAVEKIEPKLPQHALGL